MKGAPGAHRNTLAFYAEYSLLKMLWHFMLCIVPKSRYQSHMSSPPGKNAFEAQKYCSPFITSLDHTVKYTQKMQKHRHLLIISVFLLS